MTARFAATDEGLAIADSGGMPILFDTSLDYDQSLIYLTIVDPGSRSRRLRLTVQYVSEQKPLYAQTAFVSIVGGDPVDPVDPIVFTGSPSRETDGSRLRESFSRDVDRPLLSRLTAMLSAGTFTSTFVGTTGQEVHRPSASERQAMSRVLFAFIDLGGF